MKYLKIQGLESKQYYDRDLILLHAAFQVLVDFIEKEKPAEVNDWSITEEHKKAWEEILSLYKWWTQERPNRIDPIEDPNLSFPPIGEYDNKEKYPEFHKACIESTRLEEEWNNEDQKNLHRLIDIRLFLWT